MIELAEIIIKLALSSNSNLHLYHYKDDPKQNGSNITLAKRIRLGFLAKSSDGLYKTINYFEKEFK